MFTRPIAHTTQRQICGTAPPSVARPFLRVHVDPVELLEIAGQLCQLTIAQVRTGRRRPAAMRARRIAIQAARMLGITDVSMATAIGCRPREIVRLAQAEPVDLAMCLAVCAKVLAT
jgi:hypothetical protein